jgi:competence protein ComEC
LPVTLGTFHLAAPVGLLVNVLLVPYSALLLGAGFLLMACALLLPAVAFIPGAVFEWLLSFLNWMVTVSAATPLGHFYVVGPSWWWLAGWYALLAIGAGVIRLRLNDVRAWQALGVWTIVGLTGGLLPPARDGLTCTVLSVGHGGAILLELPGGRTLLYDVGVFGAPERAERVVQHALWDAGVSQLDGLVISHADSDHYNGAAGLLQTVPIASLLLSQSAVDIHQPGIAALCDDAAKSGSAIRLVWSGDRLRADSDVEIDVLHPPTGPGDSEDNANSIVMHVRYAGRSILLTGDLEGAGLARLLSSPSRSIDVLLSPHHGANAANPPALAQWCTPSVVIASTGDRDRAAALKPVYGPDCRVLSTANHGAISVHITPDGKLSVDGFVDEN